MPAKLTLHPPRRASRFLVIHEGNSLLVGRDPECGLVIEDAKVSKQHARLAWQGSGWVLEDLGSKNGTSLNGQPASGRPLAGGDVVSFGGVPGRFQLVTDEEARSLESERLARLQTSLDMCRRLGAELDPFDLLLRFLESAIEVIQAERGFVLIRDGEGRLRAELASGFSHAPADEEDDFRGSIGAIEETLRTGHPVVVSNAQADALLGRRESVVAMGVGALACVPIRQEQELLGVIYLDSRRQSTGVTQLDVEILEALADHAAVAIGAIRLDRRLRGVVRGGGEEPRLEGLGQRIARALSPERRLSPSPDRA